MLGSAIYARVKAEVTFTQQRLQSGPPAFLRRNLNRSLDRHHLELLRARSHDNNWFHDMVANEKSAAGWDFPTVEMLNEWARGTIPVLTIESIHLRRHSTSFTRHGRKTSPIECDAEDPDWLPRRASTFTLPCSVSVVVSDILTPGKSIHNQSRAAEITKRKDSEGNPVFRVELDKPFEIEMEKLFVVLESGANKNGARRWKHTATVNYQLRLKIQCQDIGGTVRLLSQLEDCSIDHCESTLAHEVVLEVLWTHLPDCPARGTLLPVNRCEGSKSIKLDYGADVKMGWPDDSLCSPIIRHNRMLASQNDKATQLPTPSASDDLEAYQNPPLIRYVSQEGYELKSIETHNFQCVFCLDGHPAHSSFERLLLHYLTHHGHFTYEVAEGSGSDANRVIKIIRLSFDRKRVPKEIDFDWKAPAQPVDLGAHLRGTGAWEVLPTAPSMDTSIRPKARVGGARGKTRKKAEAEHAGDSVRRRRTHLAPENVQDLPIPQRRAHPVPRVPGVRFYKTSSKQEVRPGELIYDSDEEIDLSWLEQTLRHDYREWSISDSAQDFHELFNRHLDAERPMADSLVRDCVVRFTRQNRDRLNQPQSADLFRYKLHQLRTGGIIDADVENYCLQYAGIRANASADASNEQAPYTNLSFGQRESSAAGRNGSLQPLSAKALRPESPAGFNSQRLGSQQPAISPRRGESAAPSSITSTPDKRRIRWSATDGRMDYRPETLLPGDHDRSADSRTSPAGHHDRSLPPMMNETAGASERAQIANSRPRPRSRLICICGESADDPRGTLVCSNISCARRFHLRCLGMDRSQRTLDWICSDCKELKGG